MGDAMSLAGSGPRASQSKRWRAPAASKSDAVRKSSEARRSVILESSPDALITFNAKGQILDFNHAAESIFGNLQGRAMRRLWSEIIRPCWLAGESKECDFGRPAERTVRDASGDEFPAELTVSPVRVAGQTVYAVWLRDVTQRRQLEVQLWRSQKMEAVGRLAGGIAHDFNNLLTVITGYSDLVLANMHANEPRRQMIEEIKNAGERASSLTRQLLAFSRRQVLAPRPLDLNAVVTNLDKLLRRLIGEDIGVLNTLEPALWTVKADPGQIEQVLVNLAVNARDAMPGGGTLTIKTSNAVIDADGARAYNPPMIPGEYVLLRVSDTGCGMDQKTQALIFEPFFTTKPEGQGTGLGLSTVYGIVKQSGGYIWVESDAGRGATFSIYLPRSNEAVLPETERTPETSAAHGGGETILVAEDEPAVRDLVQSILSEAGYNVLEASGAEEALRIASSYHGRIHLLLTDVVMPQTSGPELAKLVEGVIPDVIVVYTTGYAEKSVVQQGIVEPGAILIPKPFSPAALAREIKKALETPKPVTTARAVAEV
jgi:two-component system, cell cycle sensor histidine kinase and response regulator CckA